MPSYINASGEAVEWPYPVNYNKENEIETDVLIIGGGLAGCHAAINAVKKGATVAIVDKGPIIRSGSGGGSVSGHLRQDSHEHSCRLQACYGQSAHTLALQLEQRCHHNVIRSRSSLLPLWQKHIHRPSSAQSLHIQRPLSLR